jgi:hypothetical protein
MPEIGGKSQAKYRIPFFLSLGLSEANLVGTHLMGTDLFIDG